MMLQKVLARVQREFPTYSVMEQLEGTVEEDLSFYELSDEEAYELGSDLLYSWISHYKYVQNILKVNTLILRITIPPKLR